MNIKIKGAAWITTAGFGTLTGGEPFVMALGELPRITRKDVFDRPDQRFGRLDTYRT